MHGCKCGPSSLISTALLLQISEGKLAVMGALGAGLLVGTALSVIVPEGFHAFESAQHETGTAHIHFSADPGG